MSSTDMKLLTIEKDYVFEFSIEDRTFLIEIDKERWEMLEENNYRHIYPIRRVSEQYDYFVFQTDWRLRVYVKRTRDKRLVQNCCTFSQAVSIARNYVRQTK